MSNIFRACVCVCVIVPSLNHDYQLNSYLKFSLYNVQSMGFNIQRWTTYTTEGGYVEN